IVPNPHHKRRSMIISYVSDPTSSTFPYIFSKSSTYDNALGILAFIALGDYRNAQKVLDALWRNFDYDRKLFFSYNTHNSWPNLKDESGAVIRTGANSWVVSAIYKYLEKMKEIYPNYLETQNGNQYLSMANTLTEQMLKAQIIDSKDKRIGLLLGGHGRYGYEKNKTTGKVEEIYFNEKIEWASLEHNLDFYWQLKDYQKFNPQQNTQKAMALLTKGLMSAYNTKTKQLNRGTRKYVRDDKQALDTSSWASVVVKDLGRDKLAKTILKSSQNYLTYPRTEKRFFGHKPYLNMLVFESYKINSWMYPETPNLNWNDIKIAWGEGSYGVALANFKLGKIVSYRRMLKKLEWMTKPDGSVMYANKNIPFQFSNQGSVASTAWKIIAHYPEIIW
ncbi:hypothetical protein N9N67_11410, partial [Bacteriovoracaceae bacterium]|nr:hypothetical protein [Bacteriovoracaceae bacterium]